MKLLSRHFARHWPLLLWVVVATILFWPVRGYYVALPSPDSAPFFPAGHRLRLLEQLLAGATAISPHHLLSLIVPPLPLNDLFYYLDTLLIAIGTAWFLRGRDLPPVAAAIGGGLLAFAGYSFTLVSAGHMGFFHMTAYASFMFGALVRALRRGRWQHYVLTGILASWTLLFAPDFGPLMLALAACYALWLLLRNVDATPWPQRWPTLARGLPLALLCFALGSWPTIRTIFTEHVAHREAQIAGSTPTGNRAAAAEERPDDPQARWIFATNWSLYPSELVEFVAPNLFGTQSGDPAAPYWGKLGRTLGWEEHHQGFANFRQHTIYLGAIPLLLACFALAAWWSHRRLMRKGRDGSPQPSAALDHVAAVRPEVVALPCGDRDGSPQPSAALDHVAAARPEVVALPCGGGAGSPQPSAEAAGASPLWLTDIPFWATVWLVGLLLALGRHAPLYRLFYALPYMSLLRAPVKFIRFVELATAVLAASGLAALLAAEKRRLRGWIAAAGVLALLLLVAALWSQSATVAIQQHLVPLQLAPASHLLQRNLVRALLQGAAASAIIAALFALRTSRHYRPLLLLIPLTLWLALDFTLVNQRFIQAWDLTAHYQPNSIVKRILAEGGPVPVVANYATPNVQHDWFSHAFTANGIFNCVPSPQAPADNYFLQLNNAMQSDITRYWEVCGVEYLVLPLQAAKHLNDDRIKLLTTFQLGNREIMTASDQSQTAVLAKFVRNIPYSWFSPTWSLVSATDSLLATVDRASSTHAIVVSEVQGKNGVSEVAPGYINNIAIRHSALALKTILEVETPTEQFLTIRSHAHSRSRVTNATIDNNTANILRSNHVWLGVVVPPGNHVVTFSTVTSSVGFAVMCLPLLLVLLMGIRRGGH